jgi:phosphoglycolate phosphatase
VAGLINLNSKRVRKIKFQAILFDLDGTLLDTLTDLANATNAALKRLGFQTYQLDDYRYLVGDGIYRLAERILPKEHLDDKTLNKCVTAIKHEYSKRWAENTKPYPGITELLSELEKIGIPKAVLSNKLDDFTKVMVKKLLPGFSFNIVRGARRSIPNKPDPAAALQIADELQIPPERFMYLGDTNTDMRTANSAGMFAAGALWGFRSAEELLANGAKVLVKTPQEVLTLLVGESG